MKNLFCIIRITKTNYLLREVHNEIVLLRKLHTEKEMIKTFGKLLIFKDYSLAVRNDEKIKISKVMMETKNF